MMTGAENKRSTRQKAFTTGLLVSAILLLLMVISQYAYLKIDATEERRYTLTPATKELIENVEDRIYIKVLLEGRFPASFKRLQTATADLLREFARINPDIEYNFDDPNDGTVEEVNARREELAEAGIIPTQLRISDAAGASSQYIYPYAIIHYGNRTFPVTLLQDDIPGADKEAIINNSIGLLEYKIADGIQKIRQRTRSVIAFTAGQGELNAIQTGSIREELGKGYAVSQINLDSIAQIPSSINVLIVAKPTEAFSEAQLFMLDQYIMHGGNILFLLDPLVVSLDSINLNKNYIPVPRDLGLDPLLFRLGARVNPDLVLDLQCTRIPMVVGMQGERVQTELFPWYYHPLITSVSDHPVTKGLDRIQLEFPSSIDTIPTPDRVQKTIMLTSSPYSRIQLTPVRLNFSILREEPDPALFNKGPQSFAVMLEGQFRSMFENRLSAEQMQVLERNGFEFKPTGSDAKVLVISDGDLIKNLVISGTDEVAPLGFNKYENTTFTGNRDFLLNAVEYMLDQSGVLAARSKDIKLRLLNAVKAREEALTWQLINILGPMLVIFGFGLIYQYFRKKKFARA